MPKTRIEVEELLSRYAAGERDFSGARIEGDLSGADLSGADFNDARLSDCYMPGVNLSGANLCNASLTDSCLDRANLAGADLRGCRLRGTQLAAADLTDADMRGVLCDNTDFNGANLTRANLRGVDLDASLRRANLTEANLEDVNISGASFENTIMPDGSSLTRSPLQTYRLSIIIAKADGDSYYAQCPDLENCEVTAGSLEEARERIREAIEGYLDALQPDHKRVFLNRHVLTTVIEIPSDI
jgi:uncharacterized protein YjbI with pentapeptide repeats